MSERRLIPIDQIRRRPDARAMDDHMVASIAESIAESGLINAIRVRRWGDGYELIAGSHRYAACDSLGFREIECVVVADDDLHAELAMIDENLYRAELQPTDRARQTARRKAIYEELHPETRLGENQYSRVRQAGEPSPAERFSANTAALTGESERTVQRNVDRGQRVIPEVMDLIRGTRLDTGAYLDKLKVQTPNDQFIAANRDLAQDRRVQRKERQRCEGGAPAGAALSPEPETFVRFIKLADALVAIDVDALIASSGRQRSVLGQRASVLADRMGEIMEGLSQ